MSTGREIGTVIGAVVVGYFTAGTGYAAFATAVGGAVGGAIGASFDPTVINEGPRLDDRKVSVSTYGVGKGLCYGNNMLGGNVLWSTDKIELPFVTSNGGGKGGGGGSESVTYRYFVHMFMALCETPAPGTTIAVRKMLVDGKLVWDESSGLPVAQALASAENLFATVQLFEGFEDQQPIPLMESLAGGPGSVPAYRGTVGLWLTAIECIGGRIPQISVELSMSAETGVEIIQQIASGPSAATTGAQISQQGIYDYSVNSVSDNFVMTISYGQTGVLRPIAQAIFPNGGYIPYPVTGGPYAIAAATNGDLTLINLPDGSTSLLYQGGAGGPGSYYGRAAFGASNGYPMWVLANWNYPTADCTPMILNMAPDGGNFPVTDLPGDLNGPVVAFYGDMAHFVTTDGTRPYYSRRSKHGTVIAGAPDTTGPVDAFEGRTSALYVDFNGVYLYSVPSSGSGKIYKIHPATDTDPGSFELLCDDTGSTPNSIGRSVSTTFYCTDKAATVGPVFSSGVGVGYNLIRFNAIQLAPVKVSDIYADLMERSGEKRYDVSAIPDSETVWGIKYANPASARSNMNPLLMGFQHYVVDEDGLIKIKRYADIVSVATVSYDELSQSENEEPGDPMPLIRKQEIDLARSVTVNYQNPDFDYQTASEMEQREQTDAIDDQSVDLVMATDADHAKSVATMILYAQWRSQNTRACKLSRKFAFLSPGDGVTIEYPRGLTKLWRVTAMTDTGAVIELSMEPGDAAQYTVTGVGATGYVGQTVNPIEPPTLVTVLDIPLLRDIDDTGAGPYVAMDGYADGWTGGELFVGDDDTNLTSRGTVSDDAPTGFAETVLGTASSGFVDESNLVTVSIGADAAFVNVTRDVLIGGGGEYWAYGAPGRWEIGASALGDDLGDGRYILSRHLRGQFGTERFTGTHQAGDRFVLLRTAGLLRPSSGVGDIGQTRSYRGVTKGRSFDSAPSQTYVNTGESLMPLSPVNLRRSNTNDLSVDRRSRLAMNNSTGILPLGEAAEAYSWAFYDATFTTLIGTALTTTSTVTASQITAAGATPSGTLYVKVRQISDSVGPGHELQATA